MPHIFLLQSSGDREKAGFVLKQGRMTAVWACLVYLLIRSLNTGREDENTWYVPVLFSRKILFPPVGRFCAVRFRRYCFAGADAGVAGGVALQTIEAAAFERGGAEPLLELGFIH